MFKGKMLKVFQPTGDCIKIGRSNDCDIAIENLALAPLHAIIEVAGADAVIHDRSPEDQQTGVVVNDKKVESAELHHNDLIQLGKYSLKFIRDEVPIEDNPEPAIETRPIHQGWLQFTNGPKLGRTIKLDNPMVRLGQAGKTSAMISTRDGKYYASHLDGNQKTKVNRKNLDANDRHELSSGDTLTIGDTQMLFFLE